MQEKAGKEDIRRVRELRAAYRRGDLEAVAPFAQKDTYLLFADILRKVGVADKDAQMFAMSDMAARSAGEYLKKKNFLMAQISYNDAYRLEPDSEQKKKWAARLSDVTYTAINYHISRDEYNRASSFAHRFSSYLSRMEESNLTAR